MRAYKIPGSSTANLKGAVRGMDSTVCECRTTSPHLHPAGTHPTSPPVEAAESASDEAGAFAFLSQAILPARDFRFAEQTNFTLKHNRSPKVHTRHQVRPPKKMAHENFVRHSQPFKFSAD
jgi:hypothetical protein